MIKLDQQKQFEHFSLLQLLINSKIFFAIQILSKQIVGDYLVFEGISVTHLNNSIATKLSINNQYNFPFKKTYEYSATSGGTKIVAFK